MLSTISEVLSSCDFGRPLHIRTAALRSGLVSSGSKFKFCVRVERPSQSEKNDREYKAEFPIFVEVFSRCFPVCEHLASDCVSTRSFEIGRDATTISFCNCSYSHSLRQLLPFLCTTSGRSIIEALKLRFRSLEYSWQRLILYAAFFQVCVASA